MWRALRFCLLVYFALLPCGMRPPFFAGENFKGHAPSEDLAEPGCGAGEQGRGAAAATRRVTRETATAAFREVARALEADGGRQAGRVAARLEGGGRVEDAHHPAELHVDGGALLDQQHGVDRIRRAGDEEVLAE